MTSDSKMAVVLDWGELMPKMSARCGFGCTTRWHQVGSGYGTLQFTARGQKHYQPKTLIFNAVAIFRTKLFILNSLHDLEIMRVPSWDCGALPQGFKTAVRWSRPLAFCEDSSNTARSCSFFTPKSASNGPFERRISLTRCQPMS